MLRKRKVGLTGYVKANTGSNPNAFNVRGVEAMRCDNRSNATRRGEEPGTGKALLRIGCLVAFCAAIFYGSFAVAQNGPSKPVYLDPSKPIDDRVNDLISRMTLKEKVGQLNLPCAFVDEIGKTVPEKIEAARKFAAGTYTPEIGPGAGFFTLANTLKQADVATEVNYFNELQKIALTQTRLKIPLLEDEEGTR